MGAKCFLCLTQSDQKCPRNGGHTYCGPDHLLAHSKGDYCFPFQIEESQEFGRHFVATRDIQPLELVLIDQPAVVGPATKTRPICLECHKGPLQEETSERCEKCQFPLCDTCSRSTSLRRVHQDTECNILSTAKLGQEVRSHYSLSRVLQSPHKRDQCNCIYPDVHVYPG